jgi:hypothetical protein
MEDLFVPVFAEPSEGGTSYSISPYMHSTYDKALRHGNDVENFADDIALVGIFKLVKVDKDGKEIIKRQHTHQD